MSRSHTLHSSELDKHSAADDYAAFGHLSQVLHFAGIGMNCY